MRSIGDADRGGNKGFSRCSVVEMRMGDLIWKRKGSGKDVQLAYLFSRPTQLVYSQGMPLGVGT